MSDSGEGDHSEDVKRDVKEEGQGQGHQPEAEAETEAEAEAEAEEEDGDAEIEAMKKRVKELEQVARQLSTTGKKNAEEVNNGPDVDSRSVYVGNVDYSTTPEELQEFFSACGTVNRVTILCDKFTGHPKGFAYVEFRDQDAVVNAVILNESEFKGRQLKITPKRTNIHGFAGGRGGRGGRGGGRGGGGAPRGRGGYYPTPYGYPPPPPPHGYGYDGGYGYGPAPRGRFHNRRGTFAPY